MDMHTLLLFSATVVPLVCTPGPDMLFISSQAISGGWLAGMRANAGVCLGYLVHSMMVALGLAAIIAASPMLFEAIRWAGIAYLIYLAYKLICSACTAGTIAVQPRMVKDHLQKGFLTAVLNPKGMMIYIAILPQFISKQGNVTMQAVLLSATFIFRCAVVYSVLTYALSRVGAKGQFSDKRRRMVDGTAGGMILMAAGFMARA